MRLIDSFAQEVTNRICAFANLSDARKGEYSHGVIARNEANSAQDNQGTSMFGEGYRRMHRGYLAGGALVAHLFWLARILAPE
ncbi:MAG: hypothetical protein JWQ54_1130 [Mucilaginibacter sp.]|nr:hypothetical protein [Mucilaginibacter sp.]